MLEDICPECDFQYPGKGDGKCNKCHGTGIYNVIDATLNYMTGDDASDCDRCGGSGVCPRCDGSGLID